MSLQNKVAIVTGGAGGIGLAIARRFVTDGAKVVIADVDEKAGALAIEALSAFGTVKFVCGDVSERLDVRNMIAATSSSFGTIDILVNAAGITQDEDFLEMEEDEFDRVLRANLKGQFLCGQAVARLMVEAVGEGKPAGTIINLSSVGALVAMPRQAAYCASKGAVGQLTKAMALALAPHGIRVNAIGPAAVNCEETGDGNGPVNGDRALRLKIAARTPLGRPAELKEIAAIAAFLASDEASYLTGQTIYADGGRLALNLMMPSDDEA
ncbi:MAG: glucose 1-dehydrogenase [Hyphomicrobiales bacterium]